jgi:molybdate transport system regulatory protein
MNTAMGEKNYTIRFRLWIDEASGPFLGLGRVILLEKIKETGSITNAAKEMKMSYRQAWQLVQEMNERSTSPLVLKKLGGKGGGGASISKEAEVLIDKYHQLQLKLKRYATDEAQKLGI